ncbi:MAG: DNA polymerase III subunit chi [Acidobacteriota bacterium]|jgi:DNA polymerase-3 subunit chi|nr:DNA polymerase III subunit chi [Acidobacteriota bacterium]
MNECIFHDAPDNRREYLLFEIVERAYRGGNRILIFTSDSERAAALDRMLWILRQESFIPHRIIEPGEKIDGTDVPVGIVTVEENPIEARILIADGHCGLDFTCGFDATHEFVDHSSSDRTEACRERFRDYRARQIPVRHVKSGQ